MLSDDDNYDDDDDLADLRAGLVLGCMRDQLGNIVFDIGTGKWTQITDDTAAMSGPSLIFDHQMCLDADKRNIYVFGG